MYVQKFVSELILTNKFTIGVIINAHCSLLPCCSCSTAFAAEMLEGGTFKKLFPKIKIFLICSAQRWYSRPQGKPKDGLLGMIQYINTNYLYAIENIKLKEDQKDSREKEIKFKEIVLAAQKKPPVLSIPDNSIIVTPYPVVLLAYDVGANLFRIDEDTKFTDNYAADFFSPPAKK